MIMRALIYDGLFHPPQALLDQHSHHAGGATLMMVEASKCKFEIYREPFNATVDIAYTSKVIAIIVIITVLENRRREE